jgi:ADP-ribose pyrophosphatase YjhB (NUDIX family)
MSRLYPSQPIAAASIAVFRSGRVLLARRTRGLATALYSLPGGVVEIGETLMETALRELHEETGVIAQIAGFNTHVEFIEHDEAQKVRHHFIIASFAGIWVSGEGETGPEASDIVWADPFALGGLPVTANLSDIVPRAYRLVRDAGAAR